MQYKEGRREFSAETRKTNKKLHLIQLLAREKIDVDKLITTDMHIKRELKKKS